MSKKKKKKSNLNKRKEERAVPKKKEEATTEEKKEGHIASVRDFNEWVHIHCKQGTLYRGLKDSTWDLEASLHRRLRISNSPKDMPGFIKATEELIEKATKEEHHQKEGMKMTNLKLLAELQHIGAATCLIDFTSNPLVALWFACQRVAPKQPDEKKKTDKNQYIGGKVVALNPEDPENPKKFKIVTSEDSEKKIESFLNEGQLWVWPPPKQIPRIIAQQSVFILGKGIIEKKEIDEDFFIDKEAKESILKELEKHGISESSLFCDFAGFAQQNAWDKPYQNLAPTTTLDDYLRNAVSAYQSNEFDKAIEYSTKAIEYCNNAIEKGPQNVNAHANAHHIRGIAKGQRDDYAGAIADFDKTIQINPKHEDAYHNRGIAKNLKEDYDGAIADFDIAIQINPKHEEAYHNRGVAKGQKEDHDGAIADFDATIQINPQHGETYYFRGIVKSKKGDYKNAIMDYSKAIDINPQHVEAHYNRSLINYLLKNYEEAEKDYRKAKELAPDNPAIVPYNTIND